MSNARPDSEEYEEHRVRHLLPGEEVTGEPGSPIERGTRQEAIVALAVVGAITLAMLVRGFSAWLSIGDRPRSWQHGTQPYVPAQAYASTEPPPAASPKQVELPPPKIQPKRGQ